MGCRPAGLFVTLHKNSQERGKEAAKGLEAITSEAVERKEKGKGRIHPENAVCHQVKVKS